MTENSGVWTGVHLRIVNNGGSLDHFT